MNDERISRILEAIDKEVAVHKRVAEQATIDRTHHRAVWIIDGLARAKAIISSTAVKKEPTNATAD